jgi:hypothetical protein
MSLSLIPEKTEESLGIVKSDVLPYTDPETQVPAAQYERLKDAVIANATAIGLGDGSTPGSLTALMTALGEATLRIRVCAAVSQVGTAERSVGMFRLIAGQSFDASVVIGAGNAAHAATLRLRRFADGNTVCDWERTGLPAPVDLASPLTVPATDWYELTIAAGAAQQVAHFMGLDGSAV